MYRKHRVFKPLTNKKFYLYTGMIGVLFTTVLNSSIADTDNSNSEYITFTDIASDESTGITYRYKGIRNDEFLDAFSVFPTAELRATPARLPPMFSAPGVAIFDFDRDGDLDLYVTNGNLDRFGANAPVGTNSLYVNQLKERGRLAFVDVAASAGVAATEHDSTGVCYGDIDNDGDEDLLVLGRDEPNRLFENQGDSTFTDITVKSQAGGGRQFSSSCSMGDINGDGLLDFVVANSCVGSLLTSRCTIKLDAPPPPGFIPRPGVHNQLFLNQGDNTFAEVGKAAGIQDAVNITWAIALVDYDQDGDVDLVQSDDNAGYTQIYQNDGTGFFTNITATVGTDRPGSWMGLAFGDLNSDGNMDIFNSNVGDYFLVRSSTGATLPPGSEFTPGDANSGWFLGQDDGTFVYPGTGALGTTPFGWGASMSDYDNDGDTDIIYHGGMSLGMFVDATNPGSILNNDGAANFMRDSAALSHSTDHTRRVVRGMAIGDLNDDGFGDVVSVSSKDWPEEFPLEPILSELWGGQFDDAAYVWPLFTPVDPVDLSQGFMWNGNDPVDGTLSVEINSANNDNNWAKVKLLGGIGLTGKGRVNRDAIGAVVSFTPKHGKPAMRPIIGGASHASADSLEASFGLGTENKGTLHVLWPGGVRNTLYNVRAGERIIFPEIPCSYDDVSVSKKMYKSCVRQTLDELVDAAVLNKKEHERYMSSAKKAYEEYRNNDEDDDD